MVGAVSRSSTSSAQQAVQILAENSIRTLQVRNNLLEPVIQIYVKNGPRYNLLNSAVLEMVEFIRKENIKYIISHLLEQFGPQLESCDYIGTFAALKLKFEQNQVSRHCTHLHLHPPPLLPHVLRRVGLALP